MKRILELLGQIHKLKFPNNWNPFTMLTRDGATKTPAQATTTNQTNGKGKTMGEKNSRIEEARELEDLDPTQRLTPEGGDMSQRVYDCCAYVIICPKHEKMAVTRQPNSSIMWLPFTVLPSNRTWSEGALNGSFIVLSGGVAEKFIILRENPPFKEDYLIDVLRFQRPQTLEFTIRLIYFVKLDPKTSNKKFLCCQENARLQWVSLAILNSGSIDKLWGPELLEFARWSTSPRPQRMQAFSLEEAFFYMPRDPPRNLEEAMLKSSGVTDMDVEMLYDDFIDHCFPSFSMTIWSFTQYMTKYGFETNEHRLVRLFYAFNYKKTGYLSFHELLLGLAATESNTTHGEVRVKLIFRYYDRKNKGILFEGDFRKLVRDLYPNITDEKEFEEKVRENSQAFTISEVGGKFGITYDEFYKAVSTRQFRGTSALCRTKKPIFVCILRAMANRKAKLAISPDADKYKLTEVVTPKLYDGICRRCKEKEYTLSSRVAKLGQSQLFRNLKPVKKHPSATTASSKIRLEPFLQADHHAAQLLALIRAFNSQKGTVENPKGLLSNKVDQLTSLFQAVAYNMLQMCNSKEGKCVEVSSPCFIVGDIHGNLEDLLSMEKVLWRSLPYGANVLFLGDYVDRGKWSIECAMYVLALKVLYPHKVTLLRGNHEIREIQIKYSFLAECKSKYKGEGTKIWQLLNSVFDRMPVAAILDDTIYCAHGGIPHAVSTIAEIANQPLDIPSPDQDNEVVWEIVWSDPIHTAAFLQMCELQQEDPAKLGGFVANTKRGAAWYFAEEGANRFFATNGLTHIVRAHEVPPYGFKFHFGKKCATIFSCSHYCGNQNEAAVLHVAQENIRVVRINTYNNKPATDNK